MEASKKCTRCDEEKPLSGFYRNRSRKDGRSTWCSQCQKEYLQSPSGKASRRKGNEKYLQTPEGKAARRKAVKKYSQTAEGKKSEKKYRQTAEGREVAKRYQVSAKGRAAQRKRSRNRRSLKRKIKENYTTDMETVTKKAFYNTCSECGSTENICVDHFRPLAKGNALTLLNSCLLCRSCNGSKKDNNPEDYFNTFNYLRIKGIMTLADEYFLMMQ